MFGRKKPAAPPDPQPLTITKREDGQHVVQLPLPQRMLISTNLLAEEPIFETIITLRFANRQARYRVSYAGYSFMVGNLIQESEGRLPPPIEPDPATMQEVKRFHI